MRTETSKTEIDLDVAGDWGFTDALEGEDLRGSAYYVIDSTAWQSYNDGYRLGLTAKAALQCDLAALDHGAAVVRDEIAFMSAVLDSFRAKPGKPCEWTDEAMRTEARTIQNELHDQTVGGRNG